MHFRFVSLTCFTKPIFIGTLVDAAVDEAIDDLFARASEALIEWRHGLDQAAQRPTGSAKKGSNPPPPPPTEPDVDLEKKMGQLICQANGDQVYIII